MYLLRLLLTPDKLARTTETRIATFICPSGSKHYNPSTMSCNVELHLELGI